MNKKQQIKYLKDFMKKWNAAEDKDDYDAMDDLSDELSKFTKKNNLPNNSADELLFSLQEKSILTQDPNKLLQESLKSVKEIKLK